MPLGEQLIYPANVMNLARAYLAAVNAEPVTREELTDVFNKWNADRNSEPADLINALLAKFGGRRIEERKP